MLPPQRHDAPRHQAIPAPASGTAAVSQRGGIVARRRSRCEPRTQRFAWRLGDAAREAAVHAPSVAFQEFKVSLLTWPPAASAVQATSEECSSLLNQFRVGKASGKYRLDGKFPSGISGSSLRSGKMAGVSAGDQLALVGAPRCVTPVATLCHSLV